MLQVLNIEQDDHDMKMLYGTERHYITRTNETFKVVPHEQIEKYNGFCKMHVKSRRNLGDLKKYFSSIKLVRI